MGVGWDSRALMREERRDGLLRLRAPEARM